MQIELKQVSKRYRYEWILKKMDYQFFATESYAVLGHNGSGKSTLMQMLSGFLSPSSGRIIFSENNKILDINQVYKCVSFAAPYTELVEELTLEESLQFQQKFKHFVAGLTVNSVLELLQLPKTAKNKPVQFFSSGMKQRLKLALAILSDTPVLLLDEPTITLDTQGISWYRMLLQDYALGKKLVIIASNVEEDVRGCSQQLDILAYKKD
jgi:ABC-type multidrug transport system ATPase subunit